MSHLLLDGSKGTALGQLPHSLGRIILPTPSPGSGHPIFSFTLLSYGPSVFCFADIVGGVCVCARMRAHVVSAILQLQSKVLKRPQRSGWTGPCPSLQPTVLQPVNPRRSPSSETWPLLSPLPGMLFLNPPPEDTPFFPSLSSCGFFTTVPSGCLPPPHPCRLN